MHCAACRSDDLQPPASLNAGVKLVYERPAAAWYMAPGYIPALVVSCRSCGHLMLFERSAFLERGRFRLKQSGP